LVTPISVASAGTELRAPLHKETIMRIHAIETGRVRIKQAQIEGRGHGLWRQMQPMLSSEWADWSPVYAWAIEHPEGVIVVDTGSAAHLKSLPRWHPYFRFAVRFDIEPEQEVGPQLRHLGIGARDVKIVVLTHMHIDHDGGLAHFPHSRILASAGEIARASGVTGAFLGYLPKRWPNWFAPEPLAWQPATYGPFATSAGISAAGDVVAVPTPGHTPNHLSVIVRDGDHEVMLAGDTSYLESTMLRGTVDGVSPDEAVATATLARIREFCTQRPTVYLPAHDPHAAQRLREHRAVGVQPIARKLERVAS
jgi:glyoxylase-like metal-dependent hydrolase (beta-lactamase superfamily II)